MSISSNIDEEWVSMKKDYSIGSERIRRTKNIAHLWETTPTNRSRQSKSKKTLKKVDELYSNLLGDLTNSVEIESDRNHVEESPFKASQDEKSVLCASSTSEYPWFEKTVKGEIRGDSDDDSDLESDGEDETSRYLNMKIERVANTLQSEDSKERKEALNFLEKEIRSVRRVMGEDTIPPLHNQPPYSVENIVLTYKQYGATVSDLAKGDNDSGWYQWQRNQVPIAQQFPERRKDEGEQPPNKLEYIDEMQGNYSETKKKLQTILNICGNALFKRFSDPSEKCRSLAIKCVELLCLSGLDLGKHIAYFMPAVFSRYPETNYDPDMKIFVSDTESHDFYKRGGATHRQDRKNIVDRGQYSVRIGESSEGVRLQLCDLLSSVLRCCVHLKTLTLLDAYFTDFILAIQSALNDPFVQLKLNAVKLLINVLRLPHWEDGAKHYATAIARTALPHLRHRNARVRIAFIGLFEASISVPDREKIKGAGTEAIMDLVGFREENVLPIAAFYKAECGVTVNSLAELMTDTNVNVRYRCCQMLAFLICCLPDRYEHCQRLLPYILSFYNDSHQHIREQAITAVEQCGSQYEVENPNEIIERRQYGVDGDKRCNYTNTLPSPFANRPRIGARLFVRGNTKRFFSALLTELRSWIPKTRHQSAKLIHILVIYCEEHLTMDFHETIAGIVKSFQSCLKEEDDKESIELRATLEVLLVSIGRYVDPDTYVKVLIPRIVGDIHLGPSSSDNQCTNYSELSSVANAVALRCMILGSLPRRVVSHFFVLLPNLASEATLGHLAGNKIRVECLNIIHTLFLHVKGCSINGAQTAHFEETGRLCSGIDVMKSFKMTMKQLLHSSSAAADKEILDLVVKIEESIPDDFQDC